MKNIENPNLPQKPVSFVAISCQAGESIAKLESMGINTFAVKNDLRLPEPINSHADIQMVQINKKEILCYNEHLFLGELQKKFNIRQIKSKAGNRYPDDVKLNCSLIGNKLICNPKTIAKEILEYAYINDLKIINVNQGYSKFSVCIVNENTIITDDESIYKSAGNFLNDVLFVSKGSIRLKGYNYGFIGGCCGKIDKHKIAFNGLIETHNDYKLIIDFLSKHSVECIELNNNVLTDIGGIIPLCEQS